MRVMGATSSVISSAFGNDSSSTVSCAADANVDQIGSTRLLIATQEQEIQSLKHQLELKEGELDKLEGKVQESKTLTLDAESNKSNVDALQRKVALLEEELDTAEKHSKEVTEK